MRELADFLDKVPLLKEFNDAESGRIHSIGWTRDFPKGQVVFLGGESFHGFYVALQGTVRVNKLSSNGNETVLHVLKPYDSTSSFVRYVFDICLLDRRQSMGYAT